MIGGGGPLIQIRGGMGPESPEGAQRITPGTLKRVLPYLRAYRGTVAVLMVITALDALMIVTTPLLFKVLIDEGILPRDTAVVVQVALLVGGLAILQAAAGLAESRLSGRVSEGLVYDLRTAVFAHVQRQPLAFFTRAQTGSLVSRLNTDVVAAQQAMTSLLSMVMSSSLVLVLVLGTIFYLSWAVGLLALLIMPFFILPGRVVGRRLQRLLRESMQVDAEMGSMLNERFNVAGALLTKLYGRPADETRLFSGRAGRVRDLGVTTGVYSRLLLLSVTLLASLATAVTYGLGGSLVIDGAFQIGTLVALATLLTRLFGPINQLSNAQAQVMTALVSFDRLFEVLDLKPLITERPGARALPAPGTAPAPGIEFAGVSFRYPAAAEVSLASLESFTAPAPERADDSRVLDGITFHAPAGKLTALVGPSGAGKTTLTQLVPRLYDPDEGAVRIGGHDLRELSLDSLRETVGVVTQDAHLFHETLRANLEYARPGATERELIEACEAARIWGLIRTLPDGLDTVVGDRGHRFSGGEKQRIAIARLLLKAPAVVVLDEATAHLDSESEAAVQRALSTALKGRTSLVIAHRLSTVREADQILVVDGGRIVERGVHDELLAAGGLYAELYRTQFSRPPAPPGPAEPAPVPEPAGAPRLLPPPGGGGGRPHLLPPPGGGGGRPHLLPPPGGPGHPGGRRPPG
ncbi:ABC transporter [Streptomyces inusitatus]|uniref:ABC transporter n=1 Tax=Streptomyces inusitatus TaxID=68221 RepID=A0A918PMP0_9ACTN|nr:ABC transporter ATP-binding protein [Streptomyces inusitatus]GGZ15046.1 ABC transporter [Streptomyces inusitatus]